MDEFLQKVTLFQSLPAEDLKHLGTIVTQVTLSPGETLFNEGAEGDKAYIIRRGHIEIIKKTENNIITLATLKSGDILGEMSIIEGGTRTAGARAAGFTNLIAISREQFDDLLRNSPKAAVAILKTVIGRLRSTETMIREQAKLAQLGMITTSVSHELDKPAPKTQRGAEQLRDVMGQMVGVRRKLYDLEMSPEQLRQLFSLENRLHRHARNPLTLSAAEKKERETQIALLLDERGLTNSIHYAPMMINLGYETKRLGKLVAQYNHDELAICLEWLSKAYEMYSLLEQIRRGSMRVYNISQALKGYADMDDAVMEEVDIHDELENALFTFRDDVDKGLTIERHYGVELPKFMAYPQELNQVFVHIINNAIDATGEKGLITVHPYQDEGDIVIDINDNGPGIPAEVVKKVFDPFFTTKNPGEAMGLGLHMSRRIVEHKHGGQIQFTSEPGHTCVSIRIPMER